MKKNRFVLPILIILLIIFVPLAIYGGYSHFRQSHKEENPNHLAKLDNTLYFYDHNKLIGTYKCQSTDCHESYLSKDEYLTDLNYQKEKTAGFVANDKVFITDNNQIILYSLSVQKSMLTLKKIKKDYSNEKNIIVMDTNNKYGVMDITNVNLVLPLEYQYVGSNGHNYVIKDNNRYYISTIEGKISDSYSLNIYNYNSDYIVLRSNDNYLLYDYNNSQKLSNMVIKKINFYQDNLIILSSSNTVYYFAKDLEQIYSSKGTDYRIEEDKLLIFDNNQLKEERYLNEK